VARRQRGLTSMGADAEPTLTDEEPKRSRADDIQRPQLWKSVVVAFAPPVDDESSARDFLIPTTSRESRKPDTGHWSSSLTIERAARSRGHVGLLLVVHRNIGHFFSLRIDHFGRDG